MRDEFALAVRDARSLDALVDQICERLAAGDREGLGVLRISLEELAATAWQLRHPRAFGLQSLLGDMLLQLGDMHGAHAAYQRALDLCTTDPRTAERRVVASVYSALGVIARSFGDRDLALTYGLQALIAAEAALPDDHAFVIALRRWLLGALADDDSTG